MNDKKRDVGAEEAGDDREPELFDNPPTEEEEIADDAPNDNADEAEADPADAEDPSESEAVEDDGKTETTTDIGEDLEATTDSIDDLEAGAAADDSDADPKPKSGGALRALILTPTRELAIQIKDHIQVPINIFFENSNLLRISCFSDIEPSSYVLTILR